MLPEIDPVLDLLEVPRGLVTRGETSPFKEVILMVLYM